MTLPSEADPPTVRVELAFGADLADSPLTWDWEDVSDRLRSQELTITRGSPDEAGQADAASVSLTLDNLDGALTPGDARSPWWPHVDRGLPCRVSVPSTENWLVLDANPDNYASTPDAAALDITGDLDVRVEADIDWLAVDPSPALAGKWETADGDRSWLLWLAAGTPVLSWSEDGNLDGSHSVAPMVVVPFSSSRGAVRVTLDADNGDGGHTVTAYVGPGIDGPWEILGQPIVREGTTSIHASDVPLRIGPTGELTVPPAGRIWAVEVRDGIDGTVVAAPAFDALEPGTTAWEDSAGRAWTLQGSAEVSNWLPRFVGTVDELVPHWPYGDLSVTGTDGEVVHPGEAQVTLTAAGTLRRLRQRTKPLHSTLRRHITGEQFRSGAAVGDPRVVAYWPLEDGPDATQAASPFPEIAPMTVGGEIEFASDDTLPASEALPSVSADQPAGWSASVPRANLLHWRVDLFVRLPVSHPEPFRQVLFVANTTGDVRRWIVEVSDAVIALRGEDILGGVVYTAEADPTDFFDTWTRVSLRLEQDGADTVVALAWISIGGVAIGWEDTLTSTTAGQVTSVANLWQVTPDEGISFGHLVISTDTPTGWLASGGALTGGPDTAFAGEPAGERIQRLCEEEDIRVAFTGDPAGTEAVGPQRTGTVLDLLAEAAAADGGILGEHVSDLGLHYRTRASLYNQSAALTLDAQANEIAPPFEPIVDDQRIANDVTTTRTGGSSAHVIDATSVATGRYDTSVELNVARDGQLPDQAAWRLHLGTWPGPRYPSVTTNLLVAPDTAEAWLAVRPCDRVQVTGLPPQHPTSGVDVLVEGITETISPTRWEVTAACGPAGPWDVGTIGDTDDLDTSLRRVAAAAAELASGVEADDTALSVATTAGPLWVTDPAQFPFDIVVDGEVMTVTAISGASSPQSFTVTRAANEVAKAHDAGAAVQVADPFRAAL